MLAPPAVSESPWKPRRRPRRKPLGRIALDSGKQRILRTLVMAKITLLVIATALQFVPAHKQYQGSSLDGLGSIFIGTCSGVSYTPSQPRSDRPRVVDNVHSLVADNSFIVVVGLLVLALLLGRLARWRGFWAEIAVSTISLVGLAGLGVAVVASSLTHLFQRVDSLWGEYAFGVAFAALLLVWLAHAIALQWLYRRQRKQLEPTLPRAWSVR